jgi:hypothetical protein
MKEKIFKALSEVYNIILDDRLNTFIESDTYWIIELNNTKDITISGNKNNLQSDLYIEILTKVYSDKLIVTTGNNQWSLKNGIKEWNLMMTYEIEKLNNLEKLIDKI